jgi:putative oligomerization/nucleic acid binding protein
MPGLLRGVARTAVVAGTATAVSNRVSRRQASKWADQGQTQPGYMQPVAPQQAPPPPASPAQPDRMQQLKELGELKESGVLTQAEFDAEKAKILAT